MSDPPDREEKKGSGGGGSGPGAGPGGGPRLVPLSPGEVAGLDALLQPTTGVRKKQTNGHSEEMPEERFREADEADAQNDDTMARIPPHDLEAEIAVLRLILTEDAFPKVQSILEPEDFYSGGYRVIYDAAREISIIGDQIDPVSINSYLDKKGRHAQVGGFIGLQSIISHTPRVANAVQHAKTIRLLSQQRKLLFSCQKATSEIYARIHEPNVIVEQFRSQLETFRPDNDLETSDQVLDSWIEEGPLVHVSTGFHSLDAYTGGGPIYGSRWYVVGAPDAGKTAVLVQLGHEFAEKGGIAVGYLAVDEEAGDVIQRFAQRLGVSRHECEQRNPAVVQFIRERINKLPIQFYGPEVTIESAADRLSVFARELQKERSEGEVRSVLLIDSIQVVRCAAMIARASEGKEPSLYEQVTANVAAVRSVASRHKILVISTSEMGRNFYTPESKSQNNDMAAAKQSGAIEYSARVLMVLRSVKDEPDLICADLPKNKHGPSNVSVYFRINRVTQKLYEAQAPERPDKEALKEEREREKGEQKKVQTQAQIQAKEGLMREEEDAMRRILKREPGIGSKKLRLEMRVELRECSDGRTDATALRLVRMGEVRQDPAPRNGLDHYLIPPKTDA